jgi:HEAT repeat protein
MFITDLIVERVMHPLIRLSACLTLLSAFLWEFHSVNAEEQVTNGIDAGRADLKKQATIALIDCLAHPATRTEAARALTRMEADGATALIKLLEPDRDEELLMAAMSLLTSSSVQNRMSRNDVKSATQHLVPLLNNKSEEVRRHAVSAIGRLKSPRPMVTAALEKTLADESAFVRSAVPDAFVRIHAAIDPTWRYSEHYLLKGNPNEEFVIGQLVKAINDTDPTVRTAGVQAIASLDFIDEPMLLCVERLLSDPNKWTRNWAHDAIVLHGRKSKLLHKILLLGFVRNAKRADTYSHMATATLMRLGPNVVGTLLTVSNHENPIVRLQLVEALQKIYQEVKTEEVEDFGPDIDSAVNFLSAALSDEEEETRSGAALALAAVGEKAKSAVPQLIDELKGETEDLAFRELLFWAITEIGPGAAEAVPELTAMLKVKEDRKNAASALAAIGTDTAVESLIDALSSDDAEICTMAADKLADLGPPLRVQARLLELSRHRSSYVRGNVVFALKCLYDQPIVCERLKQLALNDDDERIRMRALKAIDNVATDGNEVGDVLLKAIQGDDEDVCAKAIELLRNPKNADQLSASLEILAAYLSHESEFVRHEAFIAMREMQIKDKVFVKEQLLPILRNANGQSYMSGVALDLIASLGSDGKQLLGQLLEVLETEIQRTKEGGLIPQYDREKICKTIVAVGGAAQLVELVLSDHDEENYVYWQGTTSALSDALSIRKDEDEQRLLLRILKSQSGVYPYRRSSDAKGALSVLSKFLRSDNKEFCLAAKTIIGNGGISNDVINNDLMVRLMHHPDKDIRLEAIRCAGKLGDQAQPLAKILIDLIHPFSDEGDNRVRNEVIRALGKIFGPSV